jgi:hypothetical protein
MDKLESYDIYEEFNKIDNVFFYSEHYRIMLLDDYYTYNNLEQLNYGLELLIYYTIGYVKMLIDDEDYFMLIDELEESLEKIAKKENKNIKKILKIINNMIYCKKKNVLKLIDEIKKEFINNYDFILINYKLGNIN